MKWSEAWDDARFHGGTWTTAAWCTNHVEGEGTVYDVDGTVLYDGHISIFCKVVWVGDTTDYTNPIWGQFAIVQSICSMEGVCVLELPPSLAQVP